jgi:hypothetical protein
MSREDILGAKASNAGDDFHVVWALQHAIRILDAQSTIIAVTVEGLPTEKQPTSRTRRLGRC